MEVDSWRDNRYCYYVFPTPPVKTAVITCVQQTGGRLDKHETACDFIKQIEKWKGRTHTYETLRGDRNYPRSTRSVAFVGRSTIPRISPVLSVFVHLGKNS
jgi:hypothetical protein